MAPSAGRSSEKKGNAGRASRNTTPNSVAGSNAGSTSTRSQHFGAPIYEPSTFQPILDGSPSSSVPDSNGIERVSEHSKGMVVQANTSIDGLSIGVRASGALEQELLADKADNDRKEAAANERSQAQKKTKSKRKKPKPSAPSAADRPLTHGAHAVTAQDGSHADLAEPASRAQRASRDPDTASSSLSPAQNTPTGTSAALQDQDISMDGGEQDDESMDEHQPLPTRILVDPPTFGDDPTTFDDPTVYEIRKMQPGMSEEEIREIASVADFPHNDLTDLIAGFPPDKDFSSAKPANQVQATTFATYIEAYLRPYTEEDGAFLRERGDRHSPFVVPALGKRSYKQVWAEEDGVEVSEDARVKLTSNEPHGSMDDMNDSVAETDELSNGPMVNRFISLFRNENRQEEDSAGNTGSAANGEEEAGDDDELAAILEGSSSKPTASRAPLPPATRIPEPSVEPGKKHELLNPTAQEKEARLRQELIYAGLLDETDEPNYVVPQDDQNAATLRKLQARLKQVTLENAARKSILQEKLGDMMAYQEYSNIGDDLDSQVTSAFQKRTRNQSKKNKKRSGGPGGGANAGGSSAIGIAKPLLESATKAAMDRRTTWKETVGPLFAGQNFGKIPSGSIFTKEAMARHMAKEAAAMDEEDAEE